MVLNLFFLWKCFWRSTFLTLLCNNGEIFASRRSFEVDYTNECFLKDGIPFNYVSGSIHYFRVPREYWEDRLLKMKAAGLNAISSYVAWNYHEPEPGRYRFEGKYDFEEFIKLANSMGLLVILRPGPYICAEWEMGGLPSWLLKDSPNIKLRSSDPVFMIAVTKWFNILLPKIKTLLYNNGGPIITVQVENEYGSYFACDRIYTTALKDLFNHHLGSDVVLFTTDGAAENLLKCGTIPGVLPTIDFGGEDNLTNAVINLKKFSPKGPLVNSEFYVGWLNHWGSPYALVKPENIVPMLFELLRRNASLNMYMFHGGTSFEYYNGASFPPYLPQPTSYDYDAPISETGELTTKYYIISDIISRFKPIPQVQLLPQKKIFAYGKIKMKFVTTVSQALSQLSWKPSIKSPQPLSMEEVGQNYGFIMYQHVLKFSAPAGSLFLIPGSRDRAYVMIDDVLINIVPRGFGLFYLPINVTAGQNLNILLENQGRINYNTFINDTKGIFGKIILNYVELLNWEMFCLDFNIKETVLTNIHSTNRILQIFTPSLFVGHFTLPIESGIPKDTVLNPKGWNKGQAFINGHNIGRYWCSAGPQITLYIPASFLKPYPVSNTLILLELQSSPCVNNSECYVELSNNHVIIAYTPDMINNIIHNHLFNPIPELALNMITNQTLIKKKMPSENIFNVSDVMNTILLYFTSSMKELPLLENLLKVLFISYQDWMPNFILDDHKQALIEVIQEYLPFINPLLNSSGEKGIALTDISGNHSVDSKISITKTFETMHTALKKFHIFLTHFMFFEELLVFFICFLSFILFIVVFYTFLLKNRCVKQPRSNHMYHVLVNENDAQS